MRCIALAPGADQTGFRTALRQLIAADIAPSLVNWSVVGAPNLFDAEETQAAAPVPLPRTVAEQIRLVVCHSDPQRYALLYALVWRLRHGETALPQIHSDPLVHRLYGLEKSVRRDLHKMHAFVRFRRVEKDGLEHFIAWFEPDHFIVEETADFFIDRFRGLAWKILTPKGSLSWDMRALTVGAPATRADAPSEDAFEAGWRTYYESTFNPARLNPAVMRQHMAVKYWRNLPEAQSIAGLIRAAPSRVTAMIEQQVQMPAKRDPAKAVAAMGQQDPQSLAALNRIIAAAAPMVTGGTRAVLGEGPLHPDIALVGEQPGDQEDLAGHPFVGPAGKLLDQALAEAGIDRSQVYVTNAVKHFKFEQRGKRRLHARPNTGEVKHYRWWLQKELDLVKPRLVVALGATATLALAGKALPVMKNRGPQTLDGRAGFITVHPSSLLRAPDVQSRREGFAAFVADLKAAKKLATAHRKAA
jgi:probable DNA metabolism protein